MDEITQQLQAKLDGALTSAADAAWASAWRLSESAAGAAVRTAADAVTPVLHRGQEAFATGQAHYAAAEEEALSRVRDGVRAASQHPALFTAGAVGTTLLLLPPTRRALYAATIGRVRSADAAAAAAARRGATLRQTLDAQALEARKLGERVQLAQDDYTRGRSKLIAAGSQLRSLAAQARSVETKAALLLDDLRNAPRAAAGIDELRRAAASVAKEAAAQRSAAEKQLKKVACQVPV